MNCEVTIHMDEYTREKRMDRMHDHIKKGGFASFIGFGCATCIPNPRARMIVTSTFAVSGMLLLGTAVVIHGFEILTITTQHARKQL